MRGRTPPLAPPSTQIVFTPPVFVPAADKFADFPSGFPKTCCTEDCEIIRFPRNGLDGAVASARTCEMCTWIDHDVAFSEDALRSGGGEGSSESASYVSGNAGTDSARPGVRGQVLSKCKFVKYC